MTALTDFEDRWQAIPSAPGYFANQRGEILGRRGWIMRPWASPSGYLQVPIWVGDKKKSQRVNRLVCEAFHGPAPSSKHHAAHNDGRRTNNAASNLRWATSKDNFSDRLNHGTWPGGERNGQARLTSEQVKEILQDYRAQLAKRGTLKREVRANLAQKFGVSSGAIKQITLGQSWRYVFLDLPFLPPPDSGGTLCP